MVKFEQKPPTSGSYQRVVTMLRILQKSKTMRSAFRQSSWGDQEHSDNASAVSWDCRSKVLATAPHIAPIHVDHLSHSSTPKHTKKLPCAQQESQCARRLKERIARKGGLEEGALPKCNLTSCTQIESCRGNS